MASLVLFGDSGSTALADGPGPCYPILQRG